MIYCNPYPVAASCQIGVDVVKDGMNALWTAVFDLITLGKSLDLNFGFSRIGIIDKNLKIRFKTGLTTTVQDKDFEEKMKMSNTSCSSFWKTDYNKEWARSTLGTLVKRPVTHVADAIALKTMALKMMSIDMSSTGVIRAPSNVYS